MNFKKNNKGFSLIELMLTLGIILVLGIVAYVTYPQVQALNRANAEAAYINTISAGVKNIYAAAPNFNGVTNTVLNNARVFPDNMVTGTPALPVITNSFGGSVTVVAAQLGAGAPDNSYAILTTQVEQRECVKLATGTGNNFVQVSIGGTVAAPTTLVKTFGVPAAVNVAQTATACAAAPVNLIFWGT